MDLSVIHDNEQAIALYEKLGFFRVPMFTIKHKNVINEALFTEPHFDDGDLNPYARIIINEARRRGIGVEIIDAEGAFFRLTYGGRSYVCRESLTELTTAIAMSICDDKRVTRRIVKAANVRVPNQIYAVDDERMAAFLETHKSVVVKPARGEQGKGVSVNLTTMGDIKRAITAAHTMCNDVIVEEFVQGVDLRLVVIDYRVVAGAVRKPAQVLGTGRATIRELIESQSRRRAAATGGESTIPVDVETERCVAEAGYSLDDVLPTESQIFVRKTANLHTGGTIHDVTGILHPALIEAAVQAARAIDIPVTGIDFIVKSPTTPEYWFIEANERPGLANHEPQPTAERFIDLLFPQSMPPAVRMSLNR
jgi:GNAT-family acetyltransferase (TIGR03103 family)